MPLLQLGSYVVPLLLAALFGINILSLNPNQLDIHINNHKSINNSTVEYSGILDIDGKTENFVMRMEVKELPKKNPDKENKESPQKHPEQGKVKIIIKNKNITAIYERDKGEVDTDLSEKEQQLIDRFFQEAIKYNQRAGLIGGIWGRITDTCKWILRRGK